MNCSRCGAQNRNAANFCAFCGARLISPITADRLQKANSAKIVPSKRDSSRMGKAIISAALIIIAVLIVAGGSMVYDSHSDSSPTVSNRTPSPGSPNNSTSPIKTAASLSGDGNSATNNQTALPQVSKSTQSPTSQPTQTSAQTTPNKNPGSSVDKASKNQTSNGTSKHETR